MMMVDLILLKSRNFVLTRKKFSKSQKRDFALILFAADQKTNFPVLPILVGFLEFQKFALVTDFYRLFYF